MNQALTALPPAPEKNKKQPNKQVKLPNIYILSNAIITHICKLLFKISSEGLMSISFSK